MSTNFIILEWHSPQTGYKTGPELLNEMKPFFPFQRVVGERRCMKCL